MSYNLVSRWVVGAAVLVLALQAVGFGGPTVYTFDGGLNKMAGSGTMTYANGATTTSLLQFGTVSSFAGIQPLAGNPTVMFCTTGFKTNTEGLLFNNACSPNGDVGAANVNNYTVVMDVLIPNIDPHGGSQTWFSLFNTDPTNSNDGDMFIRGKTYAYPPVALPYGNLALSGQYTSNNAASSVAYGGSTPLNQYNNYVQQDIRENTWYRIALSESSTGAYNTSSAVTTFTKTITDQYGNVQQFVDIGYGPGATIPTPQYNGITTNYSEGNAGTDTRFSFPAAGLTSWIFGDNDGDSEPFYAKDFYFTDTALTMAQLTALGGPQTTIPEPSTCILLGVGAVSLLAFGWRKRAS